MNNLDEAKNKAKNIKLVAFDVDGVMTDGSLIFDENGVEYKKFNAKDGQGIVLLNNSGYKTAIITARKNNTVKVRFEILQMTDLYEGQKNKLTALSDLMKKYDLKTSEVAYIGDDLPDIGVMKNVGLSFCPNDASEEVKKVVDVVLSKNGGSGAVREMCDFLLANLEDKSRLCELYIKTR